MAEYSFKFKPFATDDLVRIGATYDGGYVMPSRILEETGGLLSFGLSDEWQFEVEFSQKSGMRVAVFDPSVNFSFWVRKFLASIYYGLKTLDYSRFCRGLRILDYLRFFDGKRHKHFRVGIGYPGRGDISLQTAIQLADLDEPLFLKMDIEGWEYRVLSDLVLLSDRFTGFAIEFHDVDLHERRIFEFIRAIEDNFLLVHFHPNTHTTVGYNDSALVIELTFMNKSLLKPNEQFCQIDLPINGLDAPNIPGDDEPTIIFNENVHS